MFRRDRKEIRLSEHFTSGKLMRYAMPTIIMMIFSSVYGIVDGFFVSNYAGKTAFSAVNFIYPLLIILGAVGFMLGTGGCARIAMALGRKEEKKANELFSLIVYTAIAVGIFLALLGIAFIRPIAVLMGARGVLLENSVLYGRVFLSALPFYILQFFFQCVFPTAEKPKLGLYITAMAGVTNIAFDALLVGVMKGGIVGAAAATAFSQLIGGAVPLVYFGRRNTSRLKLTRCRFDGKSLVSVCANGSSEFISQISASVVAMLYNIQLMRYAGENGVAAYGVLMYVCMIFQAVFIGYSTGCAPIISYHYGAQNIDELKGLRRRSLKIISLCSVAMVLSGLLLSRPFSALFVGYDETLMEMTVTAFSIFSFSFLPSGFVIFCSSFFTALGDGLTSALISGLRTLVFQCGMVILLPLIFDINGIWWSITAAECAAMATALCFLALKREKYNY